MVCEDCENRAVYISLSGRSLCSKHFKKYFEKKVMQTIKRYSLIEYGERILVACSGGKDSTALLSFLLRLMKNKRENIAAIAVDEGISGYRDVKLNGLVEFCEENNIPLHTYSFKEQYGFTLDEAVKISRENRLKIKPCYICGVLRRSLINTYARRLGFSKVATGHNLDDEAQTILMNYLRGNPSLLARLGPKTGIVEDEGFVQRVKPFYFCTEKEDAIYAILTGIEVDFVECPYHVENYRLEIRDFLNRLDSTIPGVKHSLVNNFLEILPLLKREYSARSIGRCRVCGNPSAREVCRACMVVEKIKPFLGGNVNREQ
ncbi:MAG: TIGR00269 family protein [Candidatus Brockarchaeota archaeon]|nr:TIGR00269 family protein [Candidatus Brockarchaeota archaeon]